MENIKRVETLDWLRGAMAFSIMTYHCFGWSFHELDASTVLGRLGVYGVSIFFVLSGLSMAIVYNNYIKDITTSVLFYIRRIFRIWPLLWAVVLIMVAGSIIFPSEINYSFSRIVLNLTRGC